jgi:N-acetylneuraminic acid mutarotase
LLAAAGTCGATVAKADAAWTTASDMSAARFHFGATTLGDKVFVVGGAMFGSDAEAESLDPGANLWTASAYPLDFSLDNSVQAGDDGKVYDLGGGEDATANFVYDPALNSWSEGPRMPIGRRDFAVARTAGKIFVIGGLSDAGVTGSVMAFDAATGLWSDEAALPTPRAFLGASVGPDGRIYTFGGTSAAGPSSATEIYDPTTDSWSEGAPLPVGRSGMGVALGSGNRFFVVGGSDPWGRKLALARVDIYSPVSDTWSRGPSLPSPREGLQAVRVSGGRVLALGGRNNAGWATSSVLVLDTRVSAPVTTAARLDAAPGGR